MPHTVGLAEASRLTGKSQSTIHRAMKTGRISFTIADGARQIDAGELSRVFGMKSNGAMGDTIARHDQRQAMQWEDVASLRSLLAERDSRLADKDAVIDDLRRRLDSEADERRRLTALLTDQRQATRWRWPWRRSQ